MVFGPEDMNIIVYSFFTPQFEQWSFHNFFPRTPFHPLRLMEFLESIFFVEMENYEDPEEEEEEEDDEGEDGAKEGEEKKDEEKNGKEEDKKPNDDALFGFPTVKERNEAFAKVIQHMKDNYGMVYRSKGEASRVSALK